MARLGVQIQVVEKLLNHTSGTLAGVAGIYNRFAYADEMRDAAERWGEFVTGLVSANARRRRWVKRTGLTQWRRMLK